MQLQRDSSSYYNGTYANTDGIEGQIFSDLVTVDLSTAEGSPDRLDIVLEQGLPGPIDIMLGQELQNRGSHCRLGDSNLENKSIVKDECRTPVPHDSNRDHPGSQSSSNDALYVDEFVALDGKYRNNITEFHLGEFLRPGNIIAWVPRLVANICMRLAKKGRPASQYRLGCMYARGFGVEQNYLMAYTWCKISALQHFPKALVKLEEVEINLTPEHIDYATNLSTSYYDQYAAPFAH